MEIVNFSNQTFREIPEQDNPAYMPKKEWDAIGENGCILITKQEQQNTPYRNCGRIVVMQITPVDDPKMDESVTMIGLFWKEEDAIMYAEAYINRLS